ncbi:tripartite tricarboxylate transporter substrate binding protein [Siccirubricoccus sp. G192]|uniref:tripartite tricarboxylate transporter substrate binding protein n=1 Tax=Siccirubricoccus sp. G192 TaxID=2849651 RepID=UPI001C2BFD85|nr:tripartite tricarboxylate transporter substrate binding protein [Siccirubricoccus sp. G192]MBV1799449.1 tripartite tricarboxylate transporter substrate binding protein [Siccirubricoccus sp. G192]
MTRHDSRIQRRLILLSPVLAASGARAQPGAYPTNPIRITVPYPAGGTTDVVARVVAEALSPRLGQPIVIDNRPGAGVTVGTSFVAKAPPDGYSLLVTTLAHAINPSLFRSLPYDSEQDFIPVGMIGLTPLVLVVNPRLEARDLVGFIALLRAEPGRHTFGSAGVGSPMHVAPELFRQMTGTELRHVPYRGEAPALNDLVAGHITFAIDPVTAASGLVRSGMLRAIAVASAQRAEIMPDVPTMAEAGLPGFEAYTWTALMAPRATPPAVIERLNRDLNATLALPQVRGRLTELGVELGRAFSPAEARDFIRAETVKWAPIVRASGAVLD